MQNFTPTTPSWIDETSAQVSPEMTFNEASQLWIESRAAFSSAGKRLKGYIRENTARGYRNNIRSLQLYFGEQHLSEIRLDHLVRYQRLRVAGEEPFVRYRRPQDARPKMKNGEIVAPPKGKTPCPVKPQQVNQELAVLIRILDKANLWTVDHQRLYEPLIGEIAEIQRALRPEEQRRWLDVARSNQRWSTVYWYSLLAFDTCMGTNEIRALRLGDISLQQRQITVPPQGAKNQYRHRLIPVASDGAMWALENLVMQAQERGAKEPQHYLFPFGARGASMKSPKRRAKYDLTRPMSGSGIKREWEEVRIASGLTWFRPYDCRHTAITRLAEAGVPMAIIMKRAGHISQQMTEHYTHIADSMQVQAVRQAQQFDRPIGYRAIAAALPTVPRSPAPPAPADSAALIRQLFAELQSQCGFTPSQLREALLTGTD